jgi:hypothetical protein
MAGVLMGLAGAFILLTLTSQAGAAEKAGDQDNCDSGNASLCRTIETCTPKGFEDNGTCKWIYTKRSFYWR